MSSPFPGMDPYLEAPDLWPNVHNSLIVALRDDLATQLRPRYYVAVEERTQTVEATIVEVPLPDDIRELYLEIRTADTDQLSPWSNCCHQPVYWWVKGDVTMSASAWKSSAR